jgi:hypothetical protein
MLIGLADRSKSHGRRLGSCAGSYFDTDGTAFTSLLPNVFKTWLVRLAVHPEQLKNIPAISLFEMFFVEMRQANRFVCRIPTALLFLRNIV